MQRKISVLIADDERNIGILVKKLIHWEELNLECLGIVDNGEIALDMIRTHHPDIVITDICMPVIDGLEMIRISQAENLNPHFIIISGYREFDYAHRAMEYGVDSYLLKPIIEEKLNETLQKTTEKIIGRVQMLRQDNEIQQSLTESHTIIRQVIMKNLVEGNGLSNSATMKKHIDGERFLFFIVKLDYVNSQDSLNEDEKYKDTSTEQVQKMIRECLKDSSDVIIYPWEDRFFCLVGYADGKADYIFLMISRILLQIKEYLRGFDLQDVTIGIGEEKDSLELVLESLDEAKRAVVNRIKYGTGRLIPYSIIGKEKISSSELNEIMNNRYHEIRSTKENYSVPGLFALVDELFAVLENKTETDLSCLIEVADTLERIIMETDRKNWAPDEKEMMEYRLLLHNSRTLQEFHWVVKHHLSNILNSMRAAAESQYTKPVRIAKEYMESYYNQHITLDSIAELVDMNPVYFSTVFKRETGENISAFLQNVRIEQAKKLLVETNETTAAIAGMVGYSDSRYFAKVFLKATGMRPATYRRLHA
ncbi:MAG: response regulator [Lachnospiraceae bacterium]|nr:response regulator [Lachnospiraceae bacterium]